MLAILHLLATFVANLFRSRRRLEIENLHGAGTHTDMFHAAPARAPSGRSRHRLIQRTRVRSVKLRPGDKFFGTIVVTCFVVMSFLTGAAKASMRSRKGM
jgi:hypothetical protein